MIPETLFRGMDAEQLTLQYSPSLSVPDAAQCMQAWSDSSRRFRQQFTLGSHLGLHYGEKPRQIMDVFNAAENAPVFVYLHGGYWQRTSIPDYSFLAEVLTAKGICVVIPEYTLCPENTVSGIVSEMRDAIAWIYRNIGHYGGDRNKIHISGHSAGGQLTAMMAMTDWAGLADDLPPDLIKSGLSISGVFELEPLVHTPINDPLSLDLQQAQAMSPYLHDARFLVPMTFAVGGDESDEFRRQSSDMHIRWQSFGYESGYLPLAGRNHFNVINMLAEKDSDLITQVLNDIHN